MQQHKEDDCVELSIVLRPLQIIYDYVDTDVGNDDEIVRNPVLLFKDKVSVRPHTTQALYENDFDLPVYPHWVEDGQYLCQQDRTRIRVVSMKAQCG